MSVAECAEADKLFEKVLELQIDMGREVTGIHLLATFVQRHMQPLEARVHGMWVYLGTADPTRTHAYELSTNKVKKTVRSRTILSEDDPCDIQPLVLPYEASNPLLEVLPAFLFAYTVYFLRSMPY